MRAETPCDGEAVPAKFLTTTRAYLGLNRNVAVLALSLFGLGLGEELWQSYVPKYLTALGASSVLVGVFASMKDLLDGLYQYPGGWAGDRFGRKRALMLFTVTAMVGYVCYALAWHWGVVFVGLWFVMAWKSGAGDVRGGGGRRRWRWPKENGSEFETFASLSRRRNVIEFVDRRHSMR